jgi:hypothetical protein
MEMDPSKSDLYVCEPSSSISHQFMSTSSVEQSSSSGFCPSSSSTSSNEKYTREKIQYLLKHSKTEYVVLDNSTNKNVSICWCLFGFPAKIDTNGIPQKLKILFYARNALLLIRIFQTAPLFLTSIVVILLIEKSILLHLHRRLLKL